MTKRIKLLNDAEIKDIYDRPQFTDEERTWFFELDRNEKAILDFPVSIATKVDTILQLGFFKLKNQFFTFEFHDVKPDADYILDRYFDNQLLDKIKVGREVKNKNQQWILKLLGYQNFRMKLHGDSFLKKAGESARLSNDPIFIFRELFEFINQEKMTIPGYTTLQNIVSNALSMEQKRIGQLLEQHLKPREEKKLFNLFKQDESFYAVTALKKQPKNFKQGEIHREIEHYQNIQSLYRVAKRILPKLEISKNSIAYYANLVEHYTVYGLSHLKKDKTCVWLLCFIYHRCQRMLDNLATMFIYTVNQYQNDIAKKSDELLLADALKENEHDENIAALIRFYVDNSIDGTQQFDVIKEKAYAVLPAEMIRQIIDRLENKKKKYKEQFTWLAVDEIARTYKPILRALLKVLPLESDKHQSLQKSIHFLKSIFHQDQSLPQVPFEKFPKKFISRKISGFIYDENKNVIYPDRYEYHCYKKIAKYLDVKSLFINESAQYKSFSSMLLANWKKNKRTVLKTLNKPRLNQSMDEFIEQKAKPLDRKIILVNEEILNGNNPHIKIKSEKDGSKKWTLPYTKKSDDINNPFYGRLPHVNIIQVLRFVNQKIKFMDQFTHIKPHYSKAKFDELAAYACLIANGTNLGTLKMADICDIPFATLHMIDSDYIRLSTLRDANDMISNAIASLPIFRYWNLHANLLHASLDGQKFITERDTLLSRFSPKYFGLVKGVVAYSMIANHVPVIAKIIGANEHESRFLFDLIWNNTSGIQPDILSTDTEGNNQLNFLLLYIIEKIFAPRYRSFGNKTESIISFSDPKQFTNFVIKPNRQLNYSLLKKEEDSIKHIIASLLMGETNQSNIIGRLSSKNFTNTTKRALWEMNAVIMSDYLLDFASDVVLRQCVHGALNRGEAYHQLRRYISMINGKNFRGSSESEIFVWNECARLLTNAIIYYNASILTKLMEHYDRHGQVIQSDFIKRLSPVAWIHIIFQGRYEFLKNDGAIDIDGLLKTLALSDLYPEEEKRILVPA